MGKKRIFVTQKKYAEHRGVSRPTISGYCRDGMLGGAAVKQGRVWKIDVGAADAALAGNLDPLGAGRVPRKKESFTPAERLTFSIARTWNERYKAALRKLEYDQKISRLVDAREAETAADAMARRVRDAFADFPERLAPVLAAATDPHTAIKILRAEIRKVLVELSGD